MPIYEARCDSCGEEYEVLCKYEERKDVVCACGADPTFLVSSANIIGAMPSKPIRVDHDTVFETNAEYRAYEKEMDERGFKVLSTKDPEWKARLHRGAEKAEKTVQKWGFRNTDHWSEVSKREQKKGGSAFTA
jgi:putative FmdB family regulatory protein